MYAYVPTRYRHRRGLGQVTGAQRVAGTVGEVASIGTPVVTGAVASAAGGATILGMSATLAVPIIGAALAGVTFAVTKLIANSGCGPTCIQAAEYANKAGDLMAQNLNAYLALAAPRPRTAQTAALANFDSLWGQLVNLCSDPKLGNAGQRCITDRQAGACKWRAAPGGWSQGPDGKWTYKGWGAAGSGGDCWNWFIGFRDPIANDPTVVDDSAAAPAAGAGGVLSGGGSGSLLPLVALGVALAALAAFGMEL